MKFFEEAYVGFQRQRYSNDDDPRLLGFMVPNGTTKAEKNRIETVDCWAQDDIDSRVIKNEPIRGFKILEVVGRYRTNNKLFRVLDPRGFELEISADNLLDLLQTTTMVNGEIVTDCVWAQHNRSYLAPATMEEYIYWKKGTKSEPTEIEEGKLYFNPGNLLSVFRFDGIYHHTYLEYKHVADRHTVSYDSLRSGYYGRQTETYNIQEYTTTVDIKMNTGKRPSYLYTEFSLDSNGHVDMTTVHVRKSHFKNLATYDEDVEAIEEMKAFSYDPEKFMLDEHISYEQEKQRGFRHNMNVSASYSAFFKDKQDAIDFDYSSIIEKINGNPNGGYRNRIEIPEAVDYNYRYYHSTRITLAQDVKQNLKINDLRS